MYVDPRILVGLHRRRLLVTALGVACGRRWMPYTDLTGIEYWVTVTLGGTRTYELRLWSPGRRPMMVRFIGHDPAVRTCYKATVEALMAHARRKMTGDVLDRIEAG